MVSAENELSIVSNLDSTTGRILVDSAAELADLSAGVLRSDAAGDAVTIRGSNFLIGDVIGESVVLGSRTEADAIGSVSQAPNTALQATDLFVDASGSLILDSMTNSIERAEVAAGPELTLVDSEGGLAVDASSDGSLVIVSAGSVEVGSVASATDVRIEAAGSLSGTATNQLAHLAAPVIDLSTGIPFAGQADLGEGQIGTSSIPLLVDATTRFSADSSNADGSLFARSVGGASGGNLPIGRIAVGAGEIELRATRIEDADDDAVADLVGIGNQVTLVADAGIGSRQTLEVSGSRG